MAKLVRTCENVESGRLVFWLIDLPLSVTLFRHHDYFFLFL